MTRWVRLRSTPPGTRNASFMTAPPAPGRRRGAGAPWRRGRATARSEPGRRRGAEGGVAPPPERRLGEAAPESRVGQPLGRAGDGAEHGQGILVGIQPADPEQAGIAVEAGGAAGGGLVARGEAAGSLQDLE